MDNRQAQLVFKNPLIRPNDRPRGLTTVFATKSDAANVRGLTRDGTSIDYSPQKKFNELFYVSGVGITIDVFGVYASAIHESAGRKSSFSQVSQLDLHLMPWQQIYLMVT